MELQYIFGLLFYHQRRLFQMLKFNIPISGRTADYVSLYKGSVGVPIYYGTSRA